MKIGILIPSQGTIRTETHLSILGMIYNTKYEMHHICQNGCYVHQNRWELVMEAIKNNCDYIFFIDSDMTFPPDTLNKLIALDKPVAGAAYNHRRFPIETTVKFADENGNLIAVDKIPEEPFKCFAVATGLMLVKADVFSNIPQPWFFFESEENGDMKTGEDVWFCKQLFKKGIDVWCDPTIQAGHVGTYIY